MKKIHINYAHHKSSWTNWPYEAQDNNCSSAISVGGFDASVGYGIEDLDEKFLSKNSHILSQARGAGYWLWKPYIILKTLETVSPDDVIFYTDARCEFIADASEYLNKCAEDESGLLLFGGPNGKVQNKTWTKRDCFSLMGADSPKYTDSLMIVASWQVVRKTDFTLKFYREFLEYGQDEKIITDLPNTCGLPNYEGFKEHRHDQSVVSILAAKYDLDLSHADPSELGNHKRHLKGNEKLNQVIDRAATRKKYDSSNWLRKNPPK